MAVNILAGALQAGVISSADGPTAVLVSGGIPVGVIALVVAVIASAVILLKPSRKPVGGAEAAAPAAAAAPVEGAAPAALDEEELAAVIAAAVLAMESSATGRQLVVREIRCVGTAGTPWAAAGRRDLMSQRNGRNCS